MLVSGMATSRRGVVGRFVLLKNTGVFLLVFFKRLMSLFLFSHHDCCKFLVDVRLKGVGHLVRARMGGTGLSWGDVKPVELDWIGGGGNGVMGCFLSIVKCAEVMRVVWATPLFQALQKS